MPKYKYTAISFSKNELVEELNSFGSLGWKLSSLNKAIDADGNDVWEAVFEREVE